MICDDLQVLSVMKVICTVLFNDASAVDKITVQLSSKILSPKAWLLSESNI